MFNQYTRITVPLSREEFEALRDSAQLDYRHPREQARYLLRNLLLRTNNNKSATAKVCEAETVSAFAGINP